VLGVQPSRQLPSPRSRESLGILHLHAQRAISLGISRRVSRFKQTCRVSIVSMNMRLRLLGCQQHSLLCTVTSRSSTSRQIQSWLARSLVHIASGIIKYLPVLFNRQCLSGMLKGNALNSPAAYAMNHVNDAPPSSHCASNVFEVKNSHAFFGSTVA